MSTQGNNLTTNLFILYFVLKTYRPEETGLAEPTFSNSWAFAATLKNNLTMQVSLNQLGNHSVQNEIQSYQLIKTKVITQELSPKFDLTFHCFKV